jgi:hypothetical protein
MKKLNFLPLLLVAPLLVGCGNGVKAPKFANKGEEVSTDKFGDDLEAAATEAAFAKADPLGSLVYSSKQGSQSETKFIREKKTISTLKSTYTLSTESKYDSANLLFQEDTKTTSKASMSDAHGKGTESGKTSTHIDMQEFTKGEKKYVVMAEKEYKEIGTSYEVTELSPAKQIFDSHVKNILSSQASHIMAAMANYATSDEEEKKNYKFYENGKIFTIEYNKVVENLEHKNGDDAVDYVESSTTKYTAQIDLTDGAWKQKYYYELSSKVEYKIAGEYEDEYRLVGDIKETKKSMAEDVKADSKDVTLKAADLSGYKENLE